MAEGDPEVAVIKWSRSPWEPGNKATGAEAHELSDRRWIDAARVSHSLPRLPGLQSHSVETSRYAHCLDLYMPEA
jgi:hypothetical protein